MNDTDSNTALLLVAHGSRRDASNDEVREVARRLRALAGGRFSRVEAAFLELAEPPIPEGIAACCAAGARRVLVLPYFLSAGRHVVTDIPREVEQGRQRCPGVEVRLCGYLGGSDELPRLLLDLVRGD
ncbi:MAG: cobalamin biosynthesis protein CbiX [Candidatus Sedimenticola endophacoides]|uniref:Cobalamin biosynthesis protein CbiX n=1 Tax=Candidatus Sedimenticola endophacoides TaxID=2548426 RepID=A0A6N4E5D6_9GAMM|nr:MAG: cobalamin biosynthesis protein CbiX [Candidatus Sedimenticola endophacoides]OQX33620.1 MAG: cobalamin biosynthesis protein CbiX [Candidatus Sedimenticola endophacoides]OQX41094.1 MAG: cobalamin biosynthesis protein CbiX [Candidatus Sedimenticola endophacoides]OQX41955.1 MAG: cobalamin biosynthesis protein CbiX [Candidatus Sedimenticola endophacoides]OQX44311.1 MAG: cobalamin biosynthesis protein CbiX [Candidatus Sedimenticola endophacoides]